jgi:hypothetical protein
MRALLWVVLAAAALWSGYWFVGSAAVERGAVRWFDQATAQGLVAQNAGIRVAGYPNRFDLTVTAPAVRDPASGYGWAGGDLRLLAMTWKPWHLIALAPETQVITTPLGDVTVTATDLRGSLVLHPGTDLALDRTVVEATALTVTGPTGTASAASARFATAEDPSRRNSHRIGLQVTDIVPDLAVQAALPDLPARIGGLHLDATVLLSAALDRHAGDTRPEVTGLILDDAQLDWGPLQVTAKGTLATVSDGTAEGQIDLRIENWRLLPAVLGQTGAIDPVLAPTVLRAMEIMAEGGKDPDILETALTFRDGWTRLGDLPIGPAPRLVQRQ